MSDTLNEIRKGVSMLYRKGDVVEVRVPRKHDVEFSPNISGFFDNLETLAQAIYQINTEYKSTVYTTLNPVRPSWMAVNNKAYIGSKTMQDEMTRAGLALEPRMKKSVLWETGKTHWAMRMSEDEDILKRRWILIDIDAGQPANTNSSAAEHANTLAMAKAVIEFLTDRGFPAPALTNSGNGHHVYVRVDLENSAEDAFLVRRFLKSLHQRFHDQFGTAHVDEGMFNAGRITKATGSFVYKGKDTTERPCRFSRVLNSASAKFAMREQLQEIAEEYELQPGESIGQWNGNNGIAIDNEELQDVVDRVRDFLDFYDLEHHDLRQTGADLILPCECPNAESHTMNGGELECVVMIASDGSLSFCCQHAHCQQLRTWKGMRAFVEEKTGNKFQWTKGTLFLDGRKVVDGKLEPLPQQSIPTSSAARPRGLQEKAIEILTSLKPECLLTVARERAAAAGVSERTLSRAYPFAGVKYERRKDDDYLVECEKICT